MQLIDALSESAHIWANRYELHAREDLVRLGRRTGDGDRGRGPARSAPPRTKKCGWKKKPTRERGRLEALPEGAPPTSRETRHLAPGLSEGRRKTLLPGDRARSGLRPRPCPARGPPAQRFIILHEPLESWQKDKARSEAETALRLQPGPRRSAFRARQQCAYWLDDRLQARPAQNSPPAQQLLPNDSKLSPLSSLPSSAGRGSAGRHRWPPTSGPGSSTRRTRMSFATSFTPTPLCCRWPEGVVAGQRWLQIAPNRSVALIQWPPTSIFWWKGDTTGRSRKLLCESCPPVSIQMAS